MSTLDPSSERLEAIGLGTAMQLHRWSSRESASKRELSSVSTQLIVRNFSELGQMTKQAGLERPIAVDRNRQANDAAGLAVDVVAAADAQQLPAAPLDHPRKLAADDRPHTAISRMRSLPPGLGAATSTARQPSIASCRLRMSSSMVSPWVAQPGMAGASGQQPPFS